MSRFVFRNQRLLDHLLRLEEEKKGELARVMGRVNRKQAVIENARTARQKVLSSSRSGLLDEVESSVRCMFFSSYEESARSARKMIRDMQAELDRARDAYIKARRKRQAMEKLKEKRHQEFLKKEEAAERKRLDDVAGQRYIRNMEMNERGRRDA